MWQRRLRGVLGMGLTWAILWGLVGAAIELLNNIAPGLTWTTAVDMWIQTLMIPGFVAGVVFSLMLLGTAGRRRFDELSLAHFAALGAFVGLLLSAWRVSVGDALLVVAPVTLLATASACCSLVAARIAERRALPGASPADDRAPLGGRR